MADYILIAQVPEGLRWDTTSSSAGQIVEVAYANPHPSATEAGKGAPFKRVTDRSIAVGQTGRVAYYREVGSMSDLLYTQTFAALPAEALPSVVAEDDDDQTLVRAALRHTLRAEQMGTKRNGVRAILSADRDGFRAGRTVTLAFPG